MSSRYSGAGYSGPLPDFKVREESPDWRYEDPDSFRGAPFRRWVHKDKYWANSDTMTIDPDDKHILEIVECPDEIPRHHHISPFWIAWEWFTSTERLPFRFGPLVYVRADWDVDEDGKPRWS